MQLLITAMESTQNRPLKSQEIAMTLNESMYFTLKDREADEAIVTERKKEAYSDNHKILQPNVYGIFPYNNSSNYIQHPTISSYFPSGLHNNQTSPVKRKSLEQGGCRGKRRSTSPRKKVNRFDGASEEEVAMKVLPDHLDFNLDIVIIGFNPGLFSAYKGHHYAGPGNHFWTCMYLSGILPEPMTSMDDYKLPELHKIGFTNMVERTTRGSADLTRAELREGGKILKEKLRYYKPKIAVFNGKGTYEYFSDKKKFLFGKQPDIIEGTNTLIWVMPSSSARCAQLPRATDKVPYYIALKKLIDHLNGLIPDLAPEETVFPVLTMKKEIEL